MYRHDSYGPLFGSGFDLCLTGDGKLNNNYCTKSIYKTENNNLLGNNGQTNFQISNYEKFIKWFLNKII